MLAKNYFWGFSLITHPTSFSLLPLMFPLSVSGLIFFAISLTPVLIIPVIVHHTQYFNFGTPQGFFSTLFYFLLRKPYLDGFLIDPEIFLFKIRFIIELLWDNLLILFLFIPWGMRRNRELILPWVISGGILFLPFIGENREELILAEPYLLPFLTLSFIFASIGVYTVFKRYKKILYFSVFLLSMFIFFRNFERCNRKWDRIVEDWVMSILKTPPKNSVLLLKGDTEVFGCFYFNKIKGMRKDLEIYDYMGFVFKNIFSGSFYKKTLYEQEKERLNKCIKWKEKGKKVFLMSPLMISSKEYKTVRNGVLFEFIKNNEKPSPLWDTSYTLHGNIFVWKKRPYFVRKILIRFILAYNMWKFNRNKDKLDMAVDVIKTIGYDIPYAQFIWGLWELINGNIKNFRISLRKIKKLEGKNFYYYFLKGKYYEFVKEYKNALRAYSNCLKHKKDNVFLLEKINELKMKFKSDF